LGFLDLNKFMRTPESTLIGKRFGRLVIIEINRSERKGKQLRRIALCKCDCGTSKYLILSNIKFGTVKSCGCFMHDRVKEACSKHGMSDTLLYGVWMSMKSRCYSAKNSHYKHYGGRGISICKEWLENLDEFVSWAQKNGHKPGLQIDRINNDGDYSPTNCRFVNRITNSRNKRTCRYYEYNGETKSLVEWVEILNLEYARIYMRLRCGWSFEKAIATPKKVNQFD
jgi:hypothetical protein